jgi:hypothetical protein
MFEIGLQRLQVDVEYGPTENNREADPVWMPKAARIEAATARQLWRNEHHFTDYKYFNVETDFKIADPELK